MSTPTPRDLLGASQTNAQRSEAQGDPDGLRGRQDGSQEFLEGTEAPTDLQDAHEDAQDAPEDADTFPREYVEKLRRESASLRDRLREAEEARDGVTEREEDLSRRLHAALLAQDGRLVDVEALPYAPEHLETPEALTSAVDALLERKPYLSAKRYATIPQGATPTSAADGFSLGAMLRGGA